MRMFLPAASILCTSCRTSLERSQCLQSGQERLRLRQDNTTSSKLLKVYRKIQKNNTELRALKKWQCLQRGGRGCVSDKTIPHPPQYQKFGRFSQCLSDMPGDSEASNQITLDKQHENNVSVSVIFLKQSTMNFCINNSILIQYLQGYL